MKKNIIITISCFLLMATGLHAATVQFMDIDTLAQRADRVWLAQLGEVQAHFLPDDRRIVSDVKIQILDVIKGDEVQDKIRPAVLRVSGGVVGDIGQQVLGSAKLVEGNKVLVFAEAHGKDRQGRDVYRVVGMAQGLFVVEHNALGQDIVRQQLDGLTRIDAQGQISASNKAAHKASIQSLKALIRKVRQVLSKVEQ